jgi:fatty acyl-ACP thioesterase A
MDLDLNRHVNNAVYAAWALETIPQVTAEEYCLKELEIAFRAEARYGDTVISRCSAENGGPQATYLHQIVDERDGRELMRGRSRWTCSNAPMVKATVSVR